MWSRYCQGYYGLESETALVEFLSTVGGRLLRAGAVIPTGDREVLFLSRHRRELQRHFLFVLPGEAILERLANKSSQYQHAESIGIPIPNSHYPQTREDLVHIAATVRFPCVLKPASSHIWRDRRDSVGHWRWLKAAEIGTPEDLLAAYEQMNKNNVELIVQERIEGADSQLYSFYAYLDRNSEPLALCVIQKIRQWPAGYGSGSYSVTCRQDDVVALGVRLLREAGYVGMANVEFKRDQMMEPSS